MKQFKVTVILQDNKPLDVVITAKDHWAAREIAKAQFNAKVVHYCAEIR